MGLFHLFETRQPRGFNLEPRYWDRKKEEEYKKKMLMENDREALHELRKINLDREWRSERRKTERNKLNRKMLIFILLAAAILVFFIFFPSTKV